MARHRKTLALIIICLPILATVITAFRVRDLPNNLQESFKSELNKHKCDDCDVNHVKDKYSVKLESATKRYEELKKAVRDKQQELHSKGAEKLSLKKSEDSDDDDDDDEDLDFFKRKITSPKEDLSKVGKMKKDAKVLRPTVSVSIEDDDDDDDDDEEDEDEDDGISILIQKSSSKNDKKKSDSTKIKSVKETKLRNNNKESDYEEDDDNDVKVKRTSKVKDNQPQEKIKNKESQPKQSSKKTKEEINVKDDISKKKEKLHQSPKQIKPKEKDNKPQAKPAIVDNDDNDDDDDDDDKEDVKKHKSANIKPDEKSKFKSSSNQDKDDEADEDEEDDDDGGFLSGLKKLAKDFTLTQSNDKPEKPTKHSDQTKIKTESKPKIKEEKKENTDKKEATKTKEDKLVDKQKAIKDEKNYVSSKKPKDSEKDMQPKQQKVTKAKDLKETKTKEIQDSRSKEDSKSKEIKDTKSKVDSKEKLKGTIKQSISSVEMLFDSYEIHSSKSQDDQMKHVTDALYRRNLLVSEFEDFYAFFPTFAPNFSRIHNPECRRHGQILLRQLRGTKLWALNMLDATAKIPSGILQGNTIQLGDFDQCLSSRAKVQLDTGSVVKVQGQYCLASFDVKAEHEELEVPVHLAQAKNLIKSRIDDPGHFVPRFSTLSWGVCVPAVCEPQDVEVVIKDSVKHYQHRSGIVIKVKVDEDDCHTQEADWLDDWFELPTILTLAFYGIIILLVVIATLQDFFARRQTGELNSEGEEQTEEQKDVADSQEEEKPASKSSDGFLSSFSLYRTVDKLLGPSSSDEIACIHGVRAIATLVLLVAHKFLPVAVTPYTNRLKITEIASPPLWSWARQGWMFTDCFLLLSGALTAHRMSKSDSAPWRLFTRYLRLTPALLAVVLFYAYVWDLISEGPMWGTLVTKNAEVCAESWWWNLLYVQNWFGFEEMCAPQTHQLALDMQLTILSVIILWVVQTEHVASRFLLPTLHLTAIYSRYTTVRDHRLTMIAYHGVTVSQLYRTARLSYTSVLHRSTPYLIGLSLGLMLRKPAKHGKLVSIVGWLTSAALWGSVWWAAMDTGATTYRYNSTFAAQYAALAPVAAALSIAWLIYAVHNSESGLFSSLLCCRPLVLISRLSYALYLCQFVVFLTNAATVRTATEFSYTSLIDVHEISAILISSTVLTLTMVIPMQSLHKLFVFTSKKSTGEETNEESEEKKESEPTVSEPDDEKGDKDVEQNHIEDVIEIPQTRNRQIFLAHREILEEIPEAEVEYEAQRDKLEGLEEILEEEEDEEMVNHIEDEDLEIIEEEGEGEVEGGEDFWAEREEYTPRRNYIRDEDADEWEWTSTGGRGAQYYRYSR